MSDEPSDKVVTLRPLRQGAEIKRSAPDDKRRACRHHSVWIWEDEPILECRACGAVLDAHDWMRKNLDGFAAGIEEKRQERDRLAAQVEELRRWNPILRAVKALERIWRGKMLPQCPHCHRGIRAEALANSGCVSPAYDEVVAAKGSPPCGT